MNPLTKAQAGGAIDYLLVVYRLPFGSRIVEILFPIPPQAKLWPRSAKLFIYIFFFERPYFINWLARASHAVLKTMRKSFTFYSTRNMSSILYL